MGLLILRKISIVCSFTDYQLEEGEHNLGMCNISVSGYAATFVGASPGVVARAEITSAKYTKEEMEIYFTHSFINTDMGMAGILQKVVEKKAVLKPDETGMYRIVKIEEVQESQTKKTEPTENGQTIEEIYATVRKAVANKEAGYDFSNVASLTGQCGYILYDLDGDGIEELIEGAEFAEARAQEAVGKGILPFGL